MNVSPSSLRGRLVLGALLVGVAFAVIFGAGATWRLHQLQEHAVGAALQGRLDLARDEVSPDGTLTLDQSSPKTDLVQIIGPDGSVRSTSTGLAQVGPLVRLADLRGHASGLRASRALEKPDIDLATLSVPITFTSGNALPAGTGALVVAVDAEGFTSATADLLRLLVVGLFSVIMAIVALSWWLTGRALSSVTKLTEEAEAVGAMKLTDGLPVPTGDAELARLVRALNRMLVRLDESHRKELAFAADAGHRLRTPVATLRAEAELALRETDPAEQVKALERIVGDADQLTLIVDRMLARSRSQGEEVVPVQAAVEAAVPGWKRQGAVTNVEVDVHIDDPVGAEVRCSGLIDIVEALVDNAVQHSPHGGRVDIALSLSADTLHIQVSDQGVGVDPALGPHIFDAWVSSRDASIAGGLGLWLAREKARELGGDVTLVSGSPGATVFSVTIPAS
ncbi:MAG: hypothetical protein JWR83_661 [Aeromicrobium sp.]|nr:hypothetical protein [Aeromicrobium sp.]